MVKVNGFILTLRTAGLLFPSTPIAIDGNRSPASKASINGNEYSPATAITATMSTVRTSSSMNHRFVSDPLMIRLYADVISLPEMTTSKAYPDDRSHRKPIQTVHRWFRDDDFIQRITD